QILAFGFDVRASNATIRRLAVYGFGNDRASGSSEGNIVLDAASNNALVEWNVVGSGAGAWADPGAGARTQADNIVGVGNTSNAQIRDNLIGFGTYMGGLQTGGPANSGWVIQSNEIRHNGIGHSNQDGVSIESGTGGTTVQGNWIADVEGNGVDMS